MRYSCAQHSLLVGLVYAAAQMCTSVANDFAERESVPDRIEFSIENLFSCIILSMEDCWRRVLVHVHVQDLDLGCEM